MLNIGYGCKEMARDLERKLGRKLAPRFNNLDYLRDDELGLSRIIADLLNPKASHGQGVLFGGWGTMERKRTLRGSGREFDTIV